MSAAAVSSLVGRRLLVPGRRSGRWCTTGTSPTGPSFEYRQQSQDDPRPRKTCTTCGFINYENPKVVCGSVLTVEAGGGGDGALGSGERLFVLGRRTIHPRRGCWGIPAGFLELGETGEEGAAREAREEMNAEIDVGGLLAVYGLPHIGQIQMIYSSVLKNDDKVAGGSLDELTVSAGQETDEVMAVPWEEIPWDSLAFPTTSWALWHHRLRTEAAGAQASIGGAGPGSPRRGRDHPGGDVVELGGGLGAGRAEGGAEGGRSGGLGPGPGAGAGAGAGSALSYGAVFSTPSSNRSMFWSPEKGLHLKDGWNVSTDS